MWSRNSYSGSLFVGDVLVPESGNVRSMTTVSQWVRIFFIFLLIYLKLHSGALPHVPFPSFVFLFFFLRLRTRQRAHYDRRESMGASPTSRSIYAPPLFFGRGEGRKHPLSCSGDFSFTCHCFFFVDYRIAVQRMLV